MPAMPRFPLGAALVPRCARAQPHPAVVPRVFASTQASTPATRPASKSLVRSALVVLAALGAGYVAGAFYPPNVALLASPRFAPPRPEAHTEEGMAIVKRVEADLHALELLQDLRNRASVPEMRDANGDVIVAEGDGDDARARSPSAHYRLSRPYESYPEERRQHNLTAGTLRGPGLLATPPIVLTKTAHGAEIEGGKAGDTTVLVHVGRSLCGHDGVVHGGLLATLFDENMARSAFHVLPAHVGVTAKLEVNYRAPTFANQNIVLQTFIQQASGRKATVTATLKTTDGQLLAEAQGLFVQPKLAQFLNTGLVKEFVDLDVHTKP